MGKLNASMMIKALGKLDQAIKQPLRLIVGGGGAMLLAYDFPLATFDIDAVPVGLDQERLNVITKKIAKELDIPADWLNPWYSTFTYVLPSDYQDRLVEVYKGKYLRVEALGKEDLLIMKCFAHRQKDVGHAKALLKKGVDAKFVEKHIEFLKSKGIPDATSALDFLDDVIDQV